jgi:hypothetical protein
MDYIVRLLSMSSGLVEYEHNRSDKEQQGRKAIARNETQQWNGHANEADRDQAGTTKH